jgi:hypothetical protein
MSWSAVIVAKDRFILVTRGYVGVSVVISLLLIGRNSLVHGFFSIIFSEGNSKNGKEKSVIFPCFSHYARTHHEQSLVSYLTGH